MSFGRGGGGSASKTEVVNPDRGAVLSEEQRVTDKYLGDYTLAMMRGAEGNYNYTPMQLYPLHNYNPTYIPRFNPNSYQSFFGTGYGAQNFNTMPQQFGLRSAGRPYMPSGQPQQQQQMYPMQQQYQMPQQQYPMGGY